MEQGKEKQYHSHFSPNQILMDKMINHSKLMLSLISIHNKDFISDTITNVFSFFSLFRAVTLNYYSELILCNTGWSFLDREVHVNIWTPVSREPDSVQPWTDAQTSCSVPELGCVHAAQTAAWPSPLPRLGQPHPGHCSEVRHTTAAG